MRRVHYFAYGANLDNDQMRERCPSARVRFRACLAHHRLDFTHFSSRWLGGAADVLPHFGEAVWGVVYDLDPADLRILDRFEGGYDRVEIAVEDDDGRSHRVLSYTVRRKRTFLPTRLYLDKMIRWGEAWDLPSEYLDRLRQIEPLDPEISRSTPEPPLPK